MEESLKQYDKFLNAKLYLIEHKVTDTLHSNCTLEQYIEVLKDIRKICHDGYQQTLDRFKRMKEEHNG